MEEISEADTISNELKSRVWGIQTVPKIRIFLWRVLSVDFAVAESLSYHGLQTDLLYRTCDASIETISHVLFLCFPTSKVWSLANVPRPQQGFSLSVCENFEFSFGVTNSSTVSTRIR